VQREQLLEEILKTVASHLGVLVSCNHGVVTGSQLLKMLRSLTRRIGAAFCLFPPAISRCALGLHLHPVIGCLLAQVLQTEAYVTQMLAPEHRLREELFDITPSIGPAISP
jgi:hypothetical protein